MTELSQLLISIYLTHEVIKFLNGPYLVVCVLDFSGLTKWEGLTVITNSHIAFLYLANYENFKIPHLRRCLFRQQGTYA